jgi:uncharacterized protein YkwD
MRLFILCLVSILFIAANPASGKNSPAPSRTGDSVVREMNLARQNPSLYANHLVALLAHFRGNILVLPNGSLMRTQEGVAAIEDAIHFLQSARPLPPMIDSPGMSLAAADHVADQAAGAFGHAGSDRSNPGERMNRYGSWNTWWGENISYGKSSARDIVVALIVDDGLPGRKHRKNIFNPEFHYAGAAIGAHARYRTVCSIEFAAGYAEKGESPNEPLLTQN